MPFPAGSSLSTPNSPLSSKGGNILSHQIKDIDYLSISTRIRAMENRLLTRERMDRMIDARENGEAMKILTECGYPEDRGGGLEGVLAQARADTF